MDLKLIEKYKALGIAEVINQDEFKNISIVYQFLVQLMQQSENFEKVT